MGRNKTQEPIGQEYVDFGQKIKELRKASNITQEEMGVIMGISKTSVVNYETGTRKIPLSMMLKFGEYFNVGLDELTGINLSNENKEHLLLSNNPRMIESIKEWYQTVGTVEFTDEELEELMRFAKYLIYKRGE